MPSVESVKGKYEFPAQRRKERYPWDAILDGTVRRIRFTEKEPMPKHFVNAVRVKAKAKGGSVRHNLEDEGLTLVVQFVAGE
jgi:hypothetical protein